MTDQLSYDEVFDVDEDVDMITSFTSEIFATITFCPVRRQSSFRPQRQVQHREAKYSRYGRRRCRAHASHDAQANNPLNLVQNTCRIF